MCLREREMRDEKREKLRECARGRVRERACVCVCVCEGAGMAFFILSGVRAARFARARATGRGAGRRREAKGEKVEKCTPALFSRRGGGCEGDRRTRECVAFSFNRASPSSHTNTNHARAGGVRNGNAGRRLDGPPPNEWKKRKEEECTHTLFSFPSFSSPLSQLSFSSSAQLGLQLAERAGDGLCEGREMKGNSEDNRGRRR